MSVLVTAGSRHGSTEEIATSIAATIAANDIPCVNPTIDEARTMSFAEIGEIDAFVIGSGVYAGRWLESPRRFVERIAPALHGRRVWFFSSGPLGAPPQHEQNPTDIPTLCRLAASTDHRLFAGKLDRSTLSLGERALVAALRAPEGDFRNWASIEEWAEEIAAGLRTLPTSVVDSP